MLEIEEPFPAELLPSVWAWADPVMHRIADDWSPKDVYGFVEHYKARQRAGMRSFVVRRGGEAGGIVAAERMNPITWVTHVIFKRSFWGPGNTVDGCSMVYRRLFEEGAQKIISFAFADNSQVVNLARKLGGDKEGVIRQATLRGGKLVDLMILGVTKEEFYGDDARAGGADRRDGKPGPGAADDGDEHFEFVDDGDEQSVLPEIPD